jgi:Ni,Fe-hydrogenase I large subunit
MNNLPGTLKTALLGTYIDEVNNPIELIRIVNSFGHFIPYKIYIINNNKLSHIIEIK